jgi:hypothetical protein
VTPQAAKARRVWDAFAPRYDGTMRLLERAQFGGGRRWVCSRAGGAVLRPGGRLLLLDHIGSHWWPVWSIQRLFEAFTVRAAGEYQTRRPLPLVRAAGFIVEETQRLKAGTVERVAAVKPTVRRPG